MNQLESPFQFLEIVRVISSEQATIVGLEAVVLGMAQGEDGIWSYGIYIYQHKIVFSCMADEIVSTGLFDKNENFYDGSSIHVNVDPDTSEGSITE